MEVEARVEGVTEASLHALVAALPASAVVLECTDRPRLKFALNDAAVARGRAAVIGAALGLRAQVMALAPGRTCYRCIYEEPPSAELIPTCDAAGVLGPAVGLAGWLMASLAVGLAEHRSETAGRLVAIDVSSTTIQTLAPSRRRDCPACAAAPRILGADVDAVPVHPGH